MSLARKAPLRRRAPLKPGQRRLRTRNRNNVPKLVRASVLVRAGGRCERCGRERPLELHHKLKRSQGGRHTESNLAAVCAWCHRFLEAHPALAVIEGFSIQLRKVA